LTSAWRTAATARHTAHFVAQATRVCYATPQQQSSKATGRGSEFVDTALRGGAMTFMAGDKVRLKGLPRTQMMTKSVSADGILCEWIEGGAFKTWTWPFEAVERVLARRGPAPGTLGCGFTGF
jgi:uncharacterized protein YodC (DUF2158 family)